MIQKTLEQQLKEKEQNKKNFEEYQKNIDQIMLKQARIELEKEKKNKFELKQKTLLQKA